MIGQGRSGRASRSDLDTIDAIIEALRQAQQRPQAALNTCLLAPSRCANTFLSLIPP